jgi:S-adenosylmethionine decarboxylase proenzyme
MRGLHLTADLHGCPPDLPLLRDARALRALCVREVERAGLQAVNDVFHVFDGEGGVTGVVLLAESHLALHSWPELNAVTLDVYVCNFSADHGSAAESLLAALIAAFEPAQVQRQRLQRGTLASSTESA